MRILPLASSLVLLAFVGGCTTETVASAPRAARKRTTTTAPVGEDNTNGEHGMNAPAGATDVPEEGTELGSESWATGKTIDANVTIKAGSTVTIEPGAAITIGKDVAITVKGTLKVASAAAHAKLDGAAWSGLVIGSGGVLDADGLDVKGADAGLWTQTGSTATFKNGVISADSPFKMEPGSKLSVVKSKVTALTSGSAIAGDFTASFMEYDKGTNGGITLNDPAGSMTISDSTLTGGGGGDYVISSAGKLVKLEYSIVSGSHCGLHFSGVDKFSIDHVTVQTNAYGAMLYGSGAGPNTITATNFKQNSTVDIDYTKDANGPTTATGSFLVVPTGITATDPKTTAIVDAKPRP